ncbi:MAG: type I secretion system permease/ATPase [Desulfovibrionaceae bacterium]|nr:type I secretion system permease/ATPase [Desulfovibrionaceae bacterium]
MTAKLKDKLKPNLAHEGNSASLPDDGSCEKEIFTNPPDDKPVEAENPAAHQAASGSASPKEQKASEAGNGFPAQTPPCGDKNDEGLSRPLSTLEVSAGDVDFEPPLIQSLAMLFKLLGKPVSSSFLLSGLPVTEAALRPSSLIRAARLGGMHAKTVYRATLREISPLTLPCILLLKNNKSCVLAGYDENGAQVLFPETGQIPTPVSLESLENEYTGYAIFGRLEGKLDRRASEIKLVKQKRWFWDTLLHFFPIYKHVLLASVVVNLLTCASPLFFMNVYDRVVPNGRNAFETLWALAVGIVIVYLFDFILRNLRSYFVDVAGKNADMVLASRLMRHLMNIKLDNKPDSTGSLANNLREFDSLREFFGSTTLLALVDLPFLFFFLGIIAFIGGPLVIVPLAAIPLVVGAGFLSQYWFQRAVEAGYKETTQKNALLIEIINGLETVKSSLAEGRMQHSWEEVVSMSANSSARIKMFSNLTLTLSVLATQMVSVLVIIWGVYRIDEQLMTMGALIAVNMLAGRAMAPLSQLASMLTRLQQSRMALKSLDLLMLLPAERPDDKPYVDFGKLRPALTLDNLYFKYPDTERWALEGVNLQINPGEKVGIIGRMGSGKSTLGRLLMGLYEPSEGAVKLDGVDIRQLDIADLRARVGYLSQDNYLFYGSVRDNIALGMPYADDRMILRAASIAGVSDFIRAHPAGFGMPVGERGMALSGGQRQAVAIARALLHDPDILVLDEPSSNMDNASEHVFKQRLAACIEDKTVIIVTHRLSMLDLVDRLVIVDNGRIVADGPKDAVLRALKDERIKGGAGNSPAPG